VLRAHFFRTVTSAAVLATVGSLLIATPSGASITLLAAPVFPSALATNVPLVRLHFNHPVTASELPRLVTSPALTVQWQQIGAREVQAVTKSELVPDSTYLINAPTRLRCTPVCYTVTHVHRSITASSSELWLQELLAKLNYLPVTFTPAVSPSPRTAFVPGSFNWKYPAMPAEFKAMWRVGGSSLILTAAIKRFQSEHSFDVTGYMDAETWIALLSDAQKLKVNATPYDYVYVSQNLPETLSLYRNGKVIFTTYVNTGIAAAPTESGTYSVYVRYLTTTMSGKNPNGTPYSDPGIPWVSYFHGGDALHGFLRSSYGWPQSLGCVEMPYNDARVVYKYTPIGTLVTVS
jgi:hypothetical protein